MDQLLGFREFFNGLHPPRLEQLFGITIPLSLPSQTSPLLSHINRKFEQLIRNLQQHMINLINNEYHLQNREKIYLFPQQLKLLKTPINILIRELLNNIQLASNIKLRGLFLTSAIQTELHDDLLLKVIGKKFSINNKANYQFCTKQKAYFVKNIFNKLLVFR